jgi:hypothetical protein
LGQVRRGDGRLEIVGIPQSIAMRDDKHFGVIMNNIIPAEVITDRIFPIRGQKVMIDADLASLYEVPAKALIS